MNYFRLGRWYNQSKVFDKHYPYFRFFWNPYHFNFIDFILWKYYQSKIYKSIMDWYYKNHPEELDDFMDKYSCHWIKDNEKITSSTLQYPPGI